jgi:hypothetical protein
VYTFNISLITVDVGADLLSSQPCPFNISLITVDVRADLLSSQPCPFNISLITEHDIFFMMKRKKIF